MRSPLPPLSSNRLGVGILVLAVAAGLAALGRSSSVVHADALPEVVEPPAAAVRASGPSATAAGLRTSFNDVLEPAMKAVVSVKAARPLQQARGQAPQDSHFPFNLPGNDDEDRGRRLEDHGSGVIVRQDGVLLTNSHVVADATEVIVTLPSGRELEATVVGTDPATDIAVLRVEEKGLPTLPLGRSSDLKVGDLVFAIGNPFDIGQTATMGIVSATGRGRLGIIRDGYEDFIQTDAAINPGNSGGALIDAQGRLIGINAAIWSHVRGNLGVGFAVPIDLASGVMQQLLEQGKVTRAYLGVSIEEVTSDVAAKMGLPVNEGALVTRVQEDTPASAAGIKPYDVILAVDGHRVVNDQQLRLTIAGRRPGSRVKLDVLRDKIPVALTVVLDELKPEHVMAARGESRVEDGTLRGVAVRSIDPTTREQLELSRDVRGVVVTRIDATAPAARAGLQAGDVILEINRELVPEAGDFRAAVDGVGEETALLRVRRDGAEAIVIVRP